MGRTACTEPQCLYSTAIPLLPLWAVRPVQSLSACTRMRFTLRIMNSTLSNISLTLFSVGSSHMFIKYVFYFRMTNQGSHPHKPQRNVAIFQCNHTNGYTCTNPAPSCINLHITTWLSVVHVTYLRSTTSQISMQYWFTPREYELYRGADKSLARPGRKQAKVSDKMAWISFGVLPCWKKKNLMTARVSMLMKSRASLTCFRTCFIPCRAKDLSAPPYLSP